MTEYDPLTLLAVFANVYRGYTAPTSGFGFLVVEDGVVNNQAADTDPINIKSESSLNLDAGFRGFIMNKALGGQVAYFSNYIQNFYAAGRKEAFECQPRIECTERRKLKRSNKAC